MYILHNQDGYFLTKSGDWADGREVGALYKTIHKDEAINQLFEVNSKDYNLRISLLECEVNSKKLPLIPNDKLPPILEEPAANSDMFSENDTADIAKQNGNLEAQH